MAGHSHRRIVRALLLALAVLAPGAATAHQVHFRRLDQVAGMMTHVFKVKVTKITRSQKHHKLKGGRKGPVSAWYVTYDCSVQEQLIGKTGKKKITVRYVMGNPTGYDKDGKVVMRISPILNGSGLEQGLEVGKSYLLCFSGFSDKDRTHYLLRAEKPGNRASILRHVGEARAWKLLRKHHAKAMKSAGAAHYDAARRCLLVVLGTSLYMVNGLDNEVHVVRINVVSPFKVNNIRVGDKFVVLSFNDKEFTSIHFSRFKPDPAAVSEGKAGAKASREKAGGGAK